MYRNSFSNDFTQSNSDSASETRRNIRTGYRIVLLIIAVQLAALIALICLLSPAHGATFVSEAQYESCQDPTHCTLVVDQRPITVHIANLDAPRLDGACDAERLLAKAAVARLSELMGAAASVQVMDIEPQGEGVVDARILVDSQDVALLLAESGVANLRTDDENAGSWCP